MPLPNVWHTRTTAGTAEADRFLDAYLDAGGIIRVCGKWWELYDVYADTDENAVADVWHWTLVRRASGAA